MQSDALRHKVIAMPNRTEAEEHLRVIRSLMEKATIYRAISTEAAAIGGILAIIGSFSMGSWTAIMMGSDKPVFAGPNRWIFFATWFAALSFAATANLLALRRAAIKRSEPFISAGMKLASLSLLPSFFVAGVITLQLFLSFWFVFVVPVWITCYGLALLSTRHFAPTSLIRLGWAFVLAGLVSFSHITTSTWGAFYQPANGSDPQSYALWQHVFQAQFLMAATFGLFHLIYAACTWPRKSSASDSGVEP
ncbi:MAG: hypothetical protein ABIZ56_01940 [Chthoniobacteraceae bacterium]